MTHTTTTSLFAIQATPLFKFERNARQTKNGKRNDTTVTTLTLTGKASNGSYGRTMSGSAAWR